MGRPSVLAVLRLMTSSNFVGCSTGRSAGWAPFRILSTYVAARRKLSRPRPCAASARTSPVLGVVLRGRRSVLCGKETSRLAVREGHRHAAWSAPQMRSRTPQACGPQALEVGAATIASRRSPLSTRLSGSSSLDSRVWHPGHAGDNVLEARRRSRSGSPPAPG